MSSQIVGNYSFICISPCAAEAEGCVEMRSCLRSGGMSGGEGCNSSEWVVQWMSGEFKMETFKDAVIQKLHRLTYFIKIMY